MNTGTTILHQLFHVSDQGLSKRAQDQLQQEFVRADRLLLIILSVYWVILATLGGLEHGYFMLGYIGGGVALLLGIAGYFVYRGTYLYRIIIGCLGCLIEALYIQQELGTPTSHLIYFISLGFLLLYRDGFAIVASLTLVMIHHSIGTYCASNNIEIAGMPIIAFNWGLWDAFATHLFWAVLMAILLCLVAYNGMMEFKANEKLLVDMEQTNRKLDEQVEERSAQLIQKSRNIQTIFANISDGVFTITSDQTFHEEHSAELEELLEAHNIVGKKVIPLLFSNTNLKKSELNALEQSLNLCLGQEQSTFESNKHHFPLECRKTYSTERKNLQLVWTPLLNKESKVEKILVRVRDITKIRELQSVAERQVKDLRIIAQLLDIAPKAFFVFLKEANDMILEEQAINKQKFTQGLQRIRVDARRLGLTFLEKELAEAEQRCLDFEETLEDGSESDFLQRERKHVAKHVDHYRMLGIDSLGWQESVSTVEVRQKQLDDAIQLLDNVDQENPEKLEQTLKKIEELLNQLRTSDSSVMV